MKKIVVLLIAVVGWTNVADLQAQDPVPTRIVVRAKAHDAKFIGTSMGGVVVAIRKAKTGALLAQGSIEGSTGDTQLLMKQPHERGTQLSRGEAAKFDTTLMLQEPVLATIEAKGPMNQPQSSIITSTQVWLIPGKHIEGDGIILDFPGFAVDIMEPRAHQLFKKGQDVPIKANVVMMCGCPTRPGGLWDSKRYEMEAWIYKNQELVDKVPMEFSGQTSLYDGTYTPRNPGTYEVHLVVYDQDVNNTGVDRTTFIYAE